VFEAGPAGPPGAGKELTPRLDVPTESVVLILWSVPKSQTIGNRKEYETWKDVNSSPLAWLPLSQL